MEKNLLRNSLERIRVWLEREAPHVAASLQPGLSFAEMQRVLGPKIKSFRIPDEVVELYAWRNGQTGTVPFFHVLLFLPFEEAVEYGNVVEEYFEGTFPLMVFQELDYDGGYQCRCGTKQKKTVPVYAWDHGQEHIETASLADLLSAIEEAFEAGAFRLNGEVGFETDEVAWNSILLTHRDEALKNVNALLQRRWTNLKGEQLSSAFNDLFKINRAEAGVLVREYLNANTDGLAEDFDGFHSAMSIGIVLQDEWIRDFLLGLIFTPHRRVREAVLSSLAWSWKGELPLSAQNVEALIEQIVTRPAVDDGDRERVMLLGASGDQHAVGALLRLFDEPCGRDTYIAALRALERLGAVEARDVFLAAAESGSDHGARIIAVRALVKLGFEDARVEAAAKALIRMMLFPFGRIPKQDESPTLQRWMEEVKQSMAD